MGGTVLAFGLASGAVLALMTAIMIPLCMRGTIDFDQSEILGYSSMVLAFMLVFLGIRREREGPGRGAITFGRAFKVGILMTLIAAAVYVVCWEIVYWNFYPTFLDDYGAHQIAKLRAGGATEAAIAAKQAEMASFAKLYANPLFNAGITFLEVFPVGLVVTLVSAAILRRREPRVA